MAPALELGALDVVADVLGVGPAVELLATVVG